MKTILLSGAISMIVALLGTRPTITVLRKRDAFRAAFAGFEPAKVARFGSRDVARLMKDAGIIRARAKIEATIAGARALSDPLQRDGFQAAAGRPRNLGACATSSPTTARRRWPSRRA